MREKLLKDEVYVNNMHLAELEENIRLVSSDISSSKNFDMRQRNEKLFCKKRNVILNTIVT
jgi:hypothetical protein